MLKRSWVIVASLYLQIPFCWRWVRLLCHRGHQKEPQTGWGFPVHGIRLCPVPQEVWRFKCPQIPSEQTLGWTQIGAETVQQNRRTESRIRQRRPQTILTSETATPSQPQARGEKCTLRGQSERGWRYLQNFWSVESSQATQKGDRFASGFRFRRISYR